MKRKIAIIVAILSIFSAGTAFGGSINGIYRGNQVVKLFSGGKELTSDVPGQIIDGKTLVPIGALRQAGFEVTWDPDTYQADVSKHDPLTDAQLAEIKKSVGIIYVHNKKGTWSQGSGFQLAGGAFVTAFHVVDEDGTIGDIRIDLNGKTYNLTEKDISYKNADRDIVALHFTNDAPGLKPQESKWLAGADVTTVGYPKQEWKVTTGTSVFAGLGDILARNRADGLAFTAKVDSGVSGGALLNDVGEVIGVITNAGYEDKPNDASPIQPILTNLK